MRRLGAGDAAEVQALVERCADYYTLVYGAPAGPDEGAKLLAELPPGRSLEDKFFFAVEGGGVLDVVRDYRESSEWYLGLMLFPPEARGFGFGTQALDRLIGWIKPQGARRLRLAVAEQNQGAVRFWERHGFRFDRQFPPREMTGRETVLLEVVRDL